MKFADQYSFRKYMERVYGVPNSEKLFALLTRPSVFEPYSDEPFMSETLISLLFAHHQLRDKFKKVLIRLRGT